MTEVPGSYEIARPANADDLTLEPGQVVEIRKALVIGLHCLSEVDRLLKRAHELHARGGRFDSDGMPWIPPGGMDDTVRKFAFALALLEAE